MKLDEQTGAVQFEEHDIRDSGGTLDDLNLWLRTFAQTQESAVAFQHARKFDRDVKELKKAFDDWFTEMLFKQETALYREVLRQTRKDLFAAWLKNEPVYTTSCIEAADVEAKRLKSFLTKPREGNSNEQGDTGA